MPAGRQKVRLQPLPKVVERISSPEVEVRHLQNGVRLYALQGITQPIVKVDVVVEAGRPFEEHLLAASGLSGILREGAGQWSSAEIAETVDQVGASLSSIMGFDHLQLQMVCLTRHADELMPVLEAVVKHPRLPAEELNLFAKRMQRKLLVDLMSNDVVAYRKATELYFGSLHPYGYNSTPELYEQLTTERLRAHHDRLFGPQNTVVFVSGQWTDGFLSQISEVWGSWQHHADVAVPRFPTTYPEPSLLEINSTKTQSAIRIGRRLFNRVHPDWPAMFVVSTVLAGYFGSRLMKVLREDKGLTYGVQSSLESLKFDGYLSISLETEKRNTKKVLKLIASELALLREKHIGPAELQMVKNYLAGYLLSQMDGPLATMDLVKTDAVETNVPTFTSSLLEQLANLDGEALRLCAERYLQPEMLSTVIVY